MLSFRKVSKAFTIIESVIAIALIAFVIITFFSSFLVGLNYVRRSFELRTSTLILQEEMSAIRECNYTQVQALGSTFSLPSMSVLKNAAGSITKSYFYGSNNIMEITLSLTWTTFDGRTERKYLATLITEKGIDKK